MAVFDSLLDVPLDQYVGDDHDDSLVPSGLVAFEPAEPEGVPAGAPPDPHLAVPFFFLKRNSVGRPVVALVRALSVAGHGQWKGKLFSNRLGVFAVRNLNAFKRKHGLPANGVYDKATHAKLAKFYDAYAIRYLLNADVVKPSTDARRRNAFLAELMYLYNRRAYESYTQRRAFDTRKPPSGLDCSASGEWAAKWSRLKSLSGYLVFGYGNTDTQIQRFRNLKGGVRGGVGTAQVGDPFYYGRGGDPSHVAYWIGGGRVWSFGAYPIKIHPHDYRHDRIAVCDLLAGQ